MESCFHIKPLSNATDHSSLIWDRGTSVHDVRRKKWVPVSRLQGLKHSKDVGDVSRNRSLLPVFFRLFLNVSGCFWIVLGYFWGHFPHHLGKRVGTHVKQLNRLMTCLLMHLLENLLGICVIASWNVTARAMAISYNWVFLWDYTSYKWGFVSTSN